ncbi:MAG: GNAT family N-acetyltransferase [Bacteroidales bacterium]|nr:GNAT family N-acetyltransferase [Bacteroidales bacterium]
MTQEVAFIRRATIHDINIIMNLLDEARNKMRALGNDIQWINGYPSRQIITTDIAQDNYYVCCDKENNIIASFAFIFGNDPTYNNIEGAWLSQQPYATIHRLGSCIGAIGVFHTIVLWASTRCQSLRFDTHEKNTPMLRQAEREGFNYCGIIYVSDGTPRKAFQRDFSDDCHTYPRNTSYSRQK